jgi:hypothetical protein
MNTNVKGLFVPITKQEEKLLMQIERTADPAERLGSAYYSLLRKGAIADYFHDLRDGQDISEASGRLAMAMAEIQRQYNADIEACLHIFLSCIPGVHVSAIQVTT